MKKMLFVDSMLMAGCVGNISGDIKKMSVLEHRPEDARIAIKVAISKFPNEFGLKAFKDDVFRISQFASFVSKNKVMLGVQMKKPDGTWIDFAKATESELKPQVIT